MKRVFWILAITAACAGCGASHPHGGRHHHHEYAPGDGALSMIDNDILIRAGGQSEDARISPDGSLSVGARVVEISPGGRAALKAYDGEAAAIVDHGIAIGVAGARFGMDTLKNVLKGLFNGTARQAGEKAKQGANELEASALKLCERFATLYDAQQTAAAEIPEFKPYAVISEKQVRQCREDEHDDDRDDDEPAAPAKPSI